MAGRGKNPPAPPLSRLLIALSLRPDSAKGKKDKIQKSREYPEDAEADEVVAVGSVAAVPVGNSAVVGTAAPATAALHTE